MKFLDFFDSSFSPNDNFCLIDGSYIFDEKGNIIETIVGAIEWDSEEMITKIKML